MGWWLLNRRTMTHLLEIMSEDLTDFPPKVRKWSSEFKFRAHKYWKKQELPESYKTQWVPETPPKEPTNNPWVDILQKQPDAPESTQTCRPSKWQYSKIYRHGAKYQHGSPLVDKVEWFVFVDTFKTFVKF